MIPVTFPVYALMKTFLVIVVFSLAFVAVLAVLGRSATLREGLPVAAVIATAVALVASIIGGRPEAADMRGARSRVRVQQGMSPAPPPSVQPRIQKGRTRGPMRP